MASKRPTIVEIEKAIGHPFALWAHQCHAISINIVRSGIVAPARVARGACEGVGGQHSWVILGDDCYDPDAQVLDPTLWSYDSTVEGIWYGRNLQRHTPFGTGSIYEWGKPAKGDGEPFELDAKLSPEAQRFLAILGPLDRKGWAQLAHAPVEGWPAKEIITAMHGDKRLSALIPIDIVGMVTDLNPSGLYLPEAEVSHA